MNKIYLFLTLFIFSQAVLSSDVIPFNRETGERILKATQKFGIQDEDLLTLILKSNPDLNIRDKRYEGTPLYWAAIKNRFSTVKILLNYGAEVNNQDVMGNTALMGASKLGFLEIVQILLPYSPDITLRNKDGKDAIDLAEENGHEEIVTLLRKYRNDYTSLEWDDDDENDNDLVDSIEPVNIDELPDGEDEFNREGRGGKWKGIQSALKIASDYRTSDMEIGDIDLDGINDKSDNDIDDDGLDNIAEEKDKNTDKDSDGIPDYMDADGGTGAMTAGVGKLKKAMNLSIALAKFRKKPSKTETKTVGLKTVGTQTNEETNILNQLKGGKYNLASILNLLRRPGQDLDKVDEDTGMNMGHLSTLNSDLALLRFLIMNGMNYDLQDKVGYTPLMYAAENGLRDIIHLLLSWYSDPFLKNDKGKTAKDLAGDRGHADIYNFILLYEQLLLKDKELADHASKRRKGLLKASGKLIGLQKEVKKKGEELGVGEKDEGQSRSFSQMLKNNRGKIQSLSNFLKNTKIDLEHKDQGTGETPLHLAVKNGDTKLVEDLLKKGTDPNQQDHNGVTPLMIAVKNNNYDIIMLLLKYISDINYKDKSGDTAVDLAIKQKNKEILDLLEKYKKLLEDLIRKAENEKREKDKNIPSALEIDKDHDGLKDDTEDPDKGSGQLSKNTSLWRSLAMMARLRAQVEKMDKEKPAVIPNPPTPTPGINTNTPEPNPKIVNKSESGKTKIKIDDFNKYSCFIQRRGNKRVVYVKTMKVRLEELPKKRPLYFLNLSGVPVEQGKVCKAGCKDLNIFHGTFRRKVVFFQNKEITLSQQMPDFIQIYEGVNGGEVLNIDIKECKGF